MNNMKLPIFPNVLTGLFLTGLVILAAGREDDVVARFAKTELGLDLARYPLGASVTNFPNSVLQPTASEGATQWRRIVMERPTRLGTNINQSVDLEFDEGRLVRLRMYVLDQDEPGLANKRRWTELQQLGARVDTKNVNRQVLETARWRLSGEGFCNVTNPFLVGFSFTAAKLAATP